jgi:hypothetical protein
MTKTRVCFLAALLAVSLASVVLVLHCRASVKGNLLALYDLSVCKQAPSSPVPPVEERLVAHAGGAVQGLAYTNSREALDSHYAEGYRVFELDFHWTSDGRLVVVHDWTEMSTRFGVKPHVFSYGEFLSARRLDGLHQLTFEDLCQWLVTHRDAFVVTDTKSSNFRFLHYLQTNAGFILPQLIVQIYRISELQAARQLGTRAVWLSVYKASYPCWALRRISGVDAFVIPVELYPRYRELVLTGKAHFYVHSVRAESVDEAFRRMPGVYGIYVD